MKKLLLLFPTLLMACLCFSQNFSFKLDYQVTYLIPKSNDTVRIRVGNAGQYLFTDSKTVTSSFRNSFRKFGGNNKNAIMSGKLFLDMSTNFMLMQMQIDNNTVWGHVDLTTFMNQNKSFDSKEETALVKKSTSEIVTINGTEYRVYEIAPANKPDDILYAAFDDTYDLDYNTYFGKLFSAALGEKFKVDIPNGALVYARDKDGNEQFRLLGIKEEQLTGTVDLNFTLE
ncbi:MAG: hypothetical protein AAF969_12780 [Bacteroidota bacterium]